MQPVNDQVEKAKKKKFKKMKQMISDKLQNIKDEDVSDSEQVDLSIELHPIRHYLDDKEEMIEQMFTSLGPTLIQNMLPPLLRTVPLHELKADCLIQLLGMSKKRVNTLIEGKELQSSSDSEFDTDDSDTEKKSAKKRSVVPKQSKVVNKKYIIDADTLNVSVDDDDGLESLSMSDDETRKEKEARKRKSSEKIKKPKKHFKSGTSSCKDKLDALSIGSTSPISISSDNESDGCSVKEIVQNGEKQVVNPKKGKTLLEILELEMRAKAIRSLLKQNSSSPQPQPQIPPAVNDKQDDLFDPNIKIKTEPVDPPSRNPNPNVELDPDIIEIIEPVDEPILVEDDEDQPNEKDKLIESSSTSKSTSPPLEPNSKVGMPVSAKSETSLTIVTILSNPLSENTDKTDPKSQTPSWSERYLENKETEKLMKTSKMCTNIRKRMKLVRSMQQKQQVKEKVEIPVVIGSISEYKKLIGSDNTISSVKEAGEAAPDSGIAPDLQNEGDSISAVKQNEGASFSIDAQNDKPSVSPDVVNVGASVSTGAQNDKQNVSPDVQHEEKSVSPDEQNEGKDVSANLPNEEKITSPDVRNEETNLSPAGQNCVKTVSSDLQNEGNSVSPDFQNEGNIVSADIQNEGNIVSADIQNEGNSVSPDLQNAGNSVSSCPQDEEKSFVSEVQNVEKSIHPDEKNEAKEIPSPIKQNSTIDSDVTTANEDSRSPENSERIMENDILEIDIPIIDLDPDSCAESASSSCKTDVSKNTVQTNGTESNPVKEQAGKSSAMSTEIPANINPPKKRGTSRNYRKGKQRKPEAEIEEGEVSSLDDESDEYCEAPIIIDSD